MTSLLAMVVENVTPMTTPMKAVMPMAVMTSMSVKPRRARLIGSPRRE
jgi:hypothetical protein